MRRSGPHPRGASLEEHRFAADTRYQRYMREAEALLTDATRAKDEGKWRDVANTLAAATQAICQAQGCARELNLIYLLSGE